LQLEQTSVPPSNHHHGGLPVRASARFKMFDLPCSIPDHKISFQRLSAQFGCQNISLTQRRKDAKENSFGARQRFASLRDKFFNATRLAA
jgi:hypothetical protein